MNTSYSVAIRTLGKSGNYFTRLIHSIKKQTIPVEKIVVYIADGYACPERIADEEYVYCPKGMVQQRALDFKEISSEFILFCDDDLEFAPDSVERLFGGLKSTNTTCISADLFENFKDGWKTKLIHALLYGEFPSLSRKFAFRIRRNTHYSYCVRPNEVMRTQSFAGGCILIRRSTFDQIRFHEEIWMDSFRYPLGEDQIFAYKLYRKGFQAAVHFNSGIIHLDAGSSQRGNVDEAFYAARVIRYIIWHRSIYTPDRRIKRIADIVSYYSFWLWLALIKPKGAMKALREAKQFTDSDVYLNIPKWEVIR